MFDPPRDRLRELFLGLSGASLSLRVNTESSLSQTCVERGIEKSAVFAPQSLGKKTNSSIAKRISKRAAAGQVSLRSPRRSPIQSLHFLDAWGLPVPSPIGRMEGAVVFGQ